MDLHFSDEQQVLRESARDFLARECPMSRVREALAAPDAFDEDTWRQLAELGWTGLALPAELGGAGLGWLELALVLEETGRALAPAALRPAAVGAAALAAGAGPDRLARLVPALAAGRARASLAHDEPGARGGPDDAVGLEAEPTGRGFRLSGAKLFVEEAHRADWLVVSARVAGEPAGFAVAARAPGVAIRPMAWVDPTLHLCEVRLSGVQVDEADRLGTADGRGWLERSLDLARVAASAELCGVAARALELSVSFARQREQFGRPIASFQAIQHRCADMLVAVEAARSATWAAAWSLAQRAEDAHTAACMAKAWCSEAGPRVAGDAIQIHGGLGFTWEQDPQLFYKRAQSLARLGGDAEWCHEEIARALVDVGG